MDVKRDKSPLDIRDMTTDAANEKVASELRDAVKVYHSIASEDEAESGTALH